jgi:hypothetical protein
MSNVTLGEAGTDQVLGAPEVPEHHVARDVVGVERVDARLAGEHRVGGCGHRVGRIDGLDERQDDGVAGLA